MSSPTCRPERSFAGSAATAASVKAEQGGLRGAAGSWWEPFRWEQMPAPPGRRRRLRFQQTQGIILLHDAGNFRQNLGDGLVVQLALLEGVVGDDLGLVVEDDRDVGVLADVVGACGPAGLSMASTNSFSFSWLARFFSFLSRPSVSLQKTAKLPILELALATVASSSFLISVTSGALASRAKTIATGLLPLRHTRHCFWSGVGAVDVQREERLGPSVVADLRAGLHGVGGQGGADQRQKRESTRQSESSSWQSLLVEERRNVGT